MSNHIKLADCTACASELELDPHIILAVARVESGSDMNSFLFEPHVFSRLTEGRYDRSHPAVSYQVWDRNKYPKTAYARQSQFDDAVKLEPFKAYEAASWGLFQIMGYHYKTLGYSNALHMATDLKSGVEPNVKAFCKIVHAMGLTQALRDENWAKFARGYNGPGYKVNNYDVKIAATYNTILKYGHFNS